MSASQPDAVIGVSRVSKSFPNGVRALDDVSLAVGEGEFVTLLGPSGCGKSTLLRLMAGLAAPSSGQVIGARYTARRDGRGDRTPATRELGFVFQHPTLMPWARVRANVRLPLELAGVPRAEADARVDAALARVGLGDFARAWPRELSGGMKMRASIARALVTAPRVLLLDEPFGALDEISRNRLDAELRDLWHDRRLTVVLVTHSIVEALFMSTRVVVMSPRPGRVVAEVPIDEPHPRGDEFRLSARFAQAALALSRRLAGGERGDDGPTVVRRSHR